MTVLIIATVSIVNVFNIIKCEKFWIRRKIYRTLKYGTFFIEKCTLT